MSIARQTYIYMYILDVYTYPFTPNTRTEVYFHLLALILSITLAAAFRRVEHT